MDVKFGYWETDLFIQLQLHSALRISYLKQNMATTKSVDKYNANDEANNV